MMQEASGSSSKGSSGSEEMGGEAGEQQEDDSLPSTEEGHSPSSAGKEEQDDNASDSEESADSEANKELKVPAKREVEELSLEEGPKSERPKKKFKEMPEGEESNANVSTEISTNPLASHGSTSKSAEAEDILAKSEAADRSGPIPLSPKGDESGEGMEPETTRDEDKKPSPVKDVSPAPQVGAVRAEGQEERAASPAATATATTVNREDPEGIRIVKEIVAKRKQQEDDGSGSVMMDGWFNWLDDLLEYYEKHGHCLVRDAENHVLYSWLKRQRIMFRKGKLEPEKLRILQLLKTNGFDKPVKQTGDKVAKNPRAQGRASSGSSSPGKQTATKQVDTAASKPSLSQELAALGTQVAQVSGEAGGNSSLPRGVPVTNPTPQGSLVPGTVSANQPSINLDTFSNLLASLQEGVGSNAALGNETFLTAAAVNAAAASRQQRVDPPARFAGSTSIDALTGNAEQNALGASLLPSSLPLESIAGALNALAPDSIRGQQIATMMRRQLEMQNPQPSSTADANSVLLMLLQQQQQQHLQRQQQQRQQRLLENLLRGQFQRDDNEPNNG